MNVKRQVLVIGAVLSVVGGSLVATPAYAASSTTESSQTVTLTSAQATAANPAQIARLDQLIHAFSQTTDTFNPNLVPTDTLASSDGKAFVSAITAQGATVSTATGAVHGLAVHSAAKKKTGKLWIDGWGVHIKAPAPVISALSAAAAGGGGTAAAVAGVLLINVEGFPVSSGGAIASGAIAAGLFTASAILALCNLYGNGAQLNYNWVTWTCWPL